MPSSCKDRQQAKARGDALETLSSLVVVYRDTLLPPSETFIRAQAESLSRFRTLYVGLRRTAGLSLPESRVRILCKPGIVGKAQRICYKLFGPTAAQRRLVANETPALIHAHFAPGCLRDNALGPRSGRPLGCLAPRI